MGSRSVCAPATRYPSLRRSCRERLLAGFRCADLKALSCELVCEQLEQLGLLLDRKMDALSRDQAPRVAKDFARQEVQAPIPSVAGLQAHPIAVLQDEVLPRSAKRRTHERLRLR